MDEDKCKGVIQGIILVNAAIFLLAAFYLTKPRSYSYVVDNCWDDVTNYLSSRKNWDAPFMILLASCLLSAGIYRIAIQPKKIKQGQVDRKEASGKDNYY